MKIGFIWTCLFDSTGSHFVLGGVQTYLMHLGRLAQSAGWTPVIFQCADKPFERLFEGIAVIGVPVRGRSSRGQRRALFRYAIRHIDLQKDVLLFGGDIWTVPCRSPRVASIQHGVSWDLPIDQLQLLPTRYLRPLDRLLFRRGLGGWMKRVLIARHFVRCFDNCHNRICVDYNFLNWYRTQTTQGRAGRIWVIPNFAPPVNWSRISARSVRTDELRIIFARRFTEYRGVRLMAQAARAILNDHPRLTFTFAGEGPEEAWLRSFFAGDRRIHITRYSPDESLNIHLEHDIAVVPSLGSEGTSLSLAEAMSAGCAPIATNIGGMTNMILDGYNGLLVMPDVNDIAEALRRLIVSPSFRLELGRRAADTADKAFSLARWNDRWRHVLEHLAEPAIPNAGGCRM